MTPEEVDALLRRAGVRPAWEGTREARPGYQQQQSPAGALADPRTLPYRRVPTRRDREFSRASLADTTQRGAFSEPRNQFAEAGMNVLETTGAPEIARGVQSIQRNQPGEAAGHFAMGGLGLLGTATLPFGSGARAAPPRIPRIQQAIPEAPPNAGAGQAADLGHVRYWVERYGGGPEAEAKAIRDYTDDLSQAGWGDGPVWQRRQQDLQAQIAAIRDGSYRQGAANMFSSRVEEAFPDLYRAPRLPNAPPRLPGRATDGSVLPIRPPEPIRQSLVGGSDDLREATLYRGSQTGGQRGRWMTPDEAAASDYGPVSSASQDTRGALEIRDMGDLEVALGNRANVLGRMTDENADVWDALDEPAVQEALRTQGHSVVRLTDDVSPAGRKHESYLFLEPQARPDGGSAQAGRDARVLRPAEETGSAVEEGLMSRDQYNVWRDLSFHQSHQVEELPRSELIVQHSIDPERLAVARRHQARNAAATGASQLPEVARVNGRLIVMDGTHRLALETGPTVRVRVLDVDRIMSPPEGMRATQNKATGEWTLVPDRAQPNAGPPRPPPMFPGGRNR